MFPDLRQVECRELAQVLARATPRSLLIVDELGEDARFICYGA